MEEATANGRDRTRMRSKEERRRIVEETLKPGASVSRVAREHNVNANQVFQWRRLYRAGLLEEGPERSGALVPVKIVGGQQRLPAKSERPRRVTTGAIEIDFGYARVRIEGAADPVSVRAAVESLRR